MMRALDAGALRRMLGFVVLAAMLWSVALVAAVVIWGGGGMSMGAITPVLALATLGTFVLNHLLRFLRWHLMLGAEGHRVPWRRSLSIFMAGLALLPTPAKAGVAARSLLLLPEGVPAHVSLAAYFAERLLDLIGLVVLATMLLGTQTSTARWLLALGVGAAGMLLVVVAPALLRALRRRAAGGTKASRALEWLAQCFADAGDMLSGWRLPWFVLLGMAANAVTGVLVWIGVQGGGSLGVDAAIGVLAVSHLSGSITMSPGGLGGFDLAMLAQLANAEVPAGNALTALSLVRIATLWGSVAVGLPLLWLGMRRIAIRERSA